MSGSVLIIFWLNLGGSSLACAINLAAWRMTPRPWRRLYGVITFLAGFYAASYVLVISGQTSIKEWSEVMRYVSLSAWTLVWCAPAAVRLHYGGRYESDLVVRTIAHIDTVTAPTADDRDTV